MEIACVVVAPDWNRRREQHSPVLCRRYSFWSLKNRRDSGFYGTTRSKRMQSRVQIRVYARTYEGCSKIIDLSHDHKYTIVKTRHWNSDKTVSKLKY